MKAVIEKEMCEQATGIRERVKEGGPFYDDSGEKISDAKARRIIREGGTVEAPNAGSGSYRAVARRLGFSTIEVENWTSSAGDWCFKLHGGRFMWQNNRYPCRGFSYCIGRGG